MTKGGMLRGFDTPKPITAGAQNKRYISAPWQRERGGHRTVAETKYGEVPTVRIEAQEEKH